MAVPNEGPFQANLQVPADAGKTALTATSENTTSRIKMTRTGQKVIGGTFQITELINLKITGRNSNWSMVNAIIQCFETVISYEGQSMATSWLSLSLSQIISPF